MLYTKRDLKKLEKLAGNTDLGPTVRDYYKKCIKVIHRDGKVDTETVRNDNG